MQFEIIHDVAFGACNTLPHTGKTRLDIRVLDPQKGADRERLEQMLESRPDTHRELALREMTFGRPVEVDLLLATGPQRGMVEGWDKLYEEEVQGRVPIDVLGVIHRRVSDRILARTPETPGFKPLREPVHVKLRPGEVQQYFLRVHSKDRKHRSAFAILIDHWLERDEGKPLYIGGLSYLLMSHHDPFRAEKPNSYRPPPKSE